MENIFKISKRGIIAILTLCMLLSIAGTGLNVTAIAAATVEETVVATEEIATVIVEESTISTENTTVVTEESTQELVPMMARGCGEENKYKLTNGYYGDPGTSGGEMRVMDGGHLGAGLFFTYLTGCPSVDNMTTPIPGGGTARITPSRSAASGWAVQIQTSAGQPFKSQRVHFN